VKTPPPAPVPRGKPVLKAVPKNDSSEPVPDAYKDNTPAPRPAGRPVFRVIDGGKTEPDT
jgi:hypothetical protein